MQALTPKHKVHNVCNEDKNEHSGFLSNIFPSFFKKSTSFRKFYTLKELLKECEYIQVKGTKSIEIQALATDSRRVVPGSLFFAIPGFRQDGHFFLEEAIARGAVAVISDQPLKLFSKTTFIQVADVRITLAKMARIFYEKPDLSLELIGITGTNGKSTVSILAQHLLKKDHPIGLLGTVVYDLGKRTLPAHRTTPDPLEFYNLLAQMKDAGCKQVLMEVTSHGIHQKRIHGVQFQLGVFLNLTQDHIDYHGSMENYFEAKAAFFKNSSQNYPKKVVINIDDPYGRKLIEQLPNDVTCTTFGTSHKADIWADNITASPQGTFFDLISPQGRLHIQTSLVGLYNVSNILAAVSIAYVLGYNLIDLKEKIASFAGVPGRLENVKAGQNYTVLVDYAHTEDALENMLQAVRALASKKLIVVFGCGGNRDVTKRPKMTQAVQRYADFAFATADNPRYENIQSIFEDMKKGVSFPAKIIFEEDRRYAIKLALSMAQTGDIVVIAGKGHETHQEFGNIVVPFDDRLVAKELIQLQSLATS